MTGRSGRTGVLERLSLARLGAQQAMGRGSRRLSVLVAPVRLTLPTRLVIAPQDLRSSEPTIAADIFAGRLTFAGRHVDTGGRSPFEVKPPTAAFAAELHGFRWLRHARAAASQMANEKTRALIADWIDLHKRSNAGIAMQGAVLSERIMAWIGQSPMLLEGADEAFYTLFVRSLHRQALLLLKARRMGLAASDNLPSLLALSYYALCMDRSGKLGAVVQTQLVHAINTEILPDGGHVGRNPQVLVDLLFDLLPLQQAFAARSLKLPPDVPAAISRMIQQLRMLLHADGMLALFNGMGVTEGSDLATILAYASPREKPLLDASFSGYQRLQNGSSTLIVDVGRVPPARWTADTHAGCLSLEFSSGGTRIFVNCGAPRRGQEPFRQLARTTAAHSTLTLDGMSSCRFRRSRVGAGEEHTVIVAGPVDVTYGREQAEGGETLIARHDGYAQTFGLQHQRSLWLGDAGRRLEARDMLIAVPSAKRSKSRIASETAISQIPFALRFHLCPGVTPGPAEGQISVILDTGRARWVFEAGGLLIDIEDSIYFATRQGQQRTLQIVVHGALEAGGTVDWSLTRLDDGAAH